MYNFYKLLKEQRYEAFGYRLEQYNKPRFLRS